MQFCWIFIVWNNCVIKIESLFPIFWYLSSPLWVAGFISKPAHLFFQLINFDRGSGVLFIYWETSLCKAVGWGPRGPGRQHTRTDSNILLYRSLHLGFAKALKCRFFFVQVRKLSHRSFVTDQTSQSQDPDHSCLRQLMHSSLCAPAPFLLETSGGGSLLGHLRPFRLSAFFSSLLLGFGWDSAAAAGLATTSIAADFCPVPIETVLWGS